MKKGGGEGGGRGEGAGRSILIKKDGQIWICFWKGSPSPQWELLLPCSPEISCFVLPYSPQSFKLRRVPSFPKNLDSGVSCSSKLLVLFIFNRYIISSPEINTIVFCSSKSLGRPQKGVVRICRGCEFRTILRPGSSALFDITPILYIDMAAQSLLELSLLKKWGFRAVAFGTKTPELFNE